MDLVEHREYGGGAGTCQLSTLACTQAPGHSGDLSDNLQPRWVPPQPEVGIYPSLCLYFCSNCIISPQYLFLITCPSCTPAPRAWPGPPEAGPGHAVGSGEQEVDVRVRALLLLTSLGRRCLLWPPPTAPPVWEGLLLRTTEINGASLDPPRSLQPARWPQSRWADSQITHRRVCVKKESYCSSLELQWAVL